MAFVLASYCIGWQTSFFHSRRSQRHEQNLTNDIRQAIGRFDADIILLSECGTINAPIAMLHRNEFEAMLHRIVGPGFDVTHHGHYTAIVRRATVQVVEAPSLKGPLSPLPAHFCRLAQHLKVQIKDSAEMPIDVWNCHLPSSRVHPLTATVRQHILQYFAINSGPRALIAGDFNSSLLLLLRYPSFHYCCQPAHQHGDIVIARGVSAHSVPCDVNSASDAHRMCVIALPVPEKLHHLLLVNRLMPSTLIARPQLSMRVCCFLDL